MKNTFVTIGFGLVLFLSGAFGGLPVSAEASSVAYPYMNYQYPEQYDYWNQYNYGTYYNTYPTTYTNYNSYQYSYPNNTLFSGQYNTYYPTGYEQYYYNAQQGPSYVNQYVDYTNQQQNAQWQYQQQLAQYYAQQESRYYYNSVAQQGGYPYYVPACSYNDTVHSSCTQYQFQAELWGANNDISCQFYGQCWNYGNGWPYAY